MDSFEFKPEQKKFDLKSLVWNFLTLGVLLGICGLAYYFLTIFNNPGSPLNLFPPVLVPTLYQTDTPTSTREMILLEDTWTPTATVKAVPSRTKAPTWTLLPVLITPSITPTFTIQPTQGTRTITPNPLTPSAEITYMVSIDFHPGNNCDWLGVAGKVLGTDSTPLQFLEILLGGNLDGKPVSLFTISGYAPAYGQSGFELVLSDHPIASTKTLWIQLLDNTAKPLTNRIYFDTYDGCTQNLVMINFTKIR